MNEQQVHDRRWAILGVLVVSLLVVALDNTILNVALPTIEQTLHASQSQQEWIVDSYVLAFAGLLLAFGVLGDRIGRRRVLVAGLAVFGLGSLVSAFAATSGQLIVTRALMGVGGAAIMPTTLSVISSVFEPSERGRAIGLWAGFSGLGVAIGPLAGGALLEHFWWGSVFLVNVPVAAFGILGVLALVPESRDPHPQRVDIGGVVLSILGLVALVYGIIKGGQQATVTVPSVYVPLLAGIVLLAGFAWLERRSSHPMLDMTLFRNPAFSAASAAITLVFFALFGATFFLTFYLQFARSYTPLEAGVRLLPIAAALAFFAPRSAKLVRRFGAKRVCTTGLVLVATAFALYQFIDVDTNIWVLEGLLVVLGTGMGNVMAPATESIMSTLPRERAGAGAAVNNTTRQVGGALGVAVLGSLLSTTYRNAVAPALQGLPVELRARAGESIGATLGVAKGVGAVEVVAPAKEAFIHALHVTSLASAGVALLGAVIVALYLPGRPRVGVRPAAATPTSADPPGHGETVETAAAPENVETDAAVEISGSRR